MRSRLPWRFMVPLVGVSLLLLGLGISAAFYAHSQERAVSQRVSRNAAALRAGEEMAIGIRDLRRQLNRYLTLADSRAAASIPTLIREVRAWLKTSEGLASTSEETQLLKEIRQGIDQINTEIDAALDPQLDSRLASDQLQTLVEVNIDRVVLLPAQRFLDLNEEMIAKSTRDNDTITDRMALTMVLLGVCGAVSGLVTGFGAARAVSRTVVQMNVPIRDAAGKLAEVVGPISISGIERLQDIRPVLRQMADQVAQVVGRLQQTQRDSLRAQQLAALGQLAAGMAHELNNPLTSIKLLVQTAAEQGATGVIEGRDLQILEEEIVRLQRSIQMFLDFARPPKLHKQALDLGAVVRRTVELVTPRAARQNVTMHLDTPNEPALIEADPEQMRQVVLNLLLNAMDAMPRGGPLAIAVSRESNAGPDNAALVALRVADSGPGIPGETLDQIFEPFVSTKESGLGLGLSICRRIVEDHGASISAANRADGGAEFVVQFPLNAAVLPTAPSQA